MLTRRALLGVVAATALTGLRAPQGARTRLILLGTAGGPTPKPNRAAPSQAIVVDGQIYVVDAGNGVARQMVLAGLKLESIRALFLTHHHSDHNADFGNLLLLAWANRLASPVDVYGPPPLARMTRDYLALNAYDIEMRMAESGVRPLAPLIVPKEIEAAGTVHSDARVKVSAALVEHPPVRSAFAFRFDTADRSIVISGDTRPSAALVDLARGADVLVHEVMHLPALGPLIAAAPNAPRLREHLLASHTTSEQVGKVAAEAGVKTLVLSHLVPGGAPFVPDSEWLAAVRPHFGGEIIVGRDLMVI